MSVSRAAPLSGCICGFGGRYPVPSSTSELVLTTVRRGSRRGSPRHPIKTSDAIKYLDIYLTRMWCTSIQKSSISIRKITSRSPIYDAINTRCVASEKVQKSPCYARFVSRRNGYSSHHNSENRRLFFALKRTFLYRSLSFGINIQILNCDGSSPVFAVEKSRKNPATFAGNWVFGYLSLTKVMYTKKFYFDAKNHLPFSVLRCDQYPLRREPKRA